MQKVNNTWIWYNQDLQAFETSFAHCLESETRAIHPSNTIEHQNTFLLQNRAASALWVPKQKPLVRFPPNHFQYLPYNPYELCKPLAIDCNSICKLHHFWFQLVQVDFYRLIQASSRQTKHWGRSEEVQESSQTYQASLKTSTLPYTSSSETGICQLSIFLFRNH